MTNHEAIDLLDNLLGMIEDNQNNDYDKALHMAIDALRKNQWIPCSERLPEEGEVVFTQANNEGMIALCIASRHDHNYWKGWNTREVNVVAWMPLPEPYTADMRGEE